MFINQTSNLAYDHAFNLVKNWLNSYDKIRPLDINANVRLKDALRAADRIGYLPMALNDLKSEKEELYRRILNRLENHKSRGEPFA
jgi:hypothetical protein